jgi:hypothetical protein
MTSMTPKNISSNKSQANKNQKKILGKRSTKNLDYLSNTSRKNSSQSLRRNSLLLSSEEGLSQTQNSEYLEEGSY